MTRRILCAALLVWLPPPPAGAEEFSRGDKLRALYSNQFTFDSRGLPMITVRIAEGLREVTIAGKAPPRVLPDGEGGTEISGGRQWQVTIKRATAARVQHFVVLARLPMDGLERLRRQASVWKGRGVQTQMMEIGTVFGLKGRVFDNRAYLLVQGPFASLAGARRAAEGHLKSGHLDRAYTVQKLQRRPFGVFEARDTGTGTRIRARDGIWFAPHKGQRLTVVVAGARGPRQYWGPVYVTVDRGGTLAVVNAAPADRMLAGLVPAEIFPSAPTAALRAQAVAARGELLAKIGTRHLADPYLLCSRQHCQVYAGVGQEHPRTTRAVNATRGQVLVRAGGSLVDTVYSASCGGHTEHNDNVWPVEPDPNLRGRLDAGAGGRALAPFRGGITAANLDRWLTTRPPTWCARARYNRDKYRWATTIEAPRLDALTRRLGLGPVRALEVRSRGVSGRARVLRVSGERGSKLVRGELTIRRLLGGLRSSMFLVAPVAGPDGKPAAFRFTGGGWGHGVGMCQTGATGMAAAGKTYQEILGHYYAGSRLVTLY
jgi:SpoIID/LytB domain protein